MNKLTVAILFGGRSAEHEVSLQSAKNVYEAIDKDVYNPILIGIGKDGKRKLYDSSSFLLHENDPKLIRLNPHGARPVALLPGGNGQLVHLDDVDSDVIVDVVFPILHGPLGEDGTVQGLLKLANIPFVGCGVLGSCVGMDKGATKCLLRDAGVPIGKFIALRAGDAIPAYEDVAQQLGDIMFIKPANMGSSVGVSKVHNTSEYMNAVQSAFDYDTKILIEEYIVGREIECAVLGNAHPNASIVGEIIPHHEFYSYEAKYIDENGAGLQIPADITPETAMEVQRLAIKTFEVLGCIGLSRVDFFLKGNGEVLVNEINTMPGFTEISMYPKLWGATGVGYGELIDKLIQLALSRFREENALRTDAHDLVDRTPKSATEMYSKQSAL